MEILGIEGIKVLYNEPIAPYTFTKLGGLVDILAIPKNQEEIKRLLAICKIQDIPWLVLGNASNIIMRDGGFRGMVILLTQMDAIEVLGETMVVQAGATLQMVTHLAMQKGLTGLEFACGIPGTVGGAVYMNAGAYGGEISDVLTSIEIITPEGEVKIIQKEELFFSYRFSRLQEEKAIVLRATFTLKKGKQEEIQKEMDHLMTLRREKQPLEYPSCGSVFKRPSGYFTGKLIQEAGLQGTKIGGAQVSTKHAGFIVNVESASATDYITLIEYNQKKIHQVYQVILETEVRIIGEEK